MYAPVPSAAVGKATEKLPSASMVASRLTPLMVIVASPGGTREPARISPDRVAVAAPSTRTGGRTRLKVGVALVMSAVVPAVVLTRW